MPKTSPLMPKLHRSASLRTGAVILVGATLGTALAGCAPISFPWFSRTPAPFIPVWDSISPPPILEGVVFEQPEPIEMGLPPSAEAFSRNLDVLHYDVELVLPPENDRIASRTSLRYLRDGVGPHLLTLDFTGLTVELVTARGEVLEFEHDAGLLRIDHPGRPGIYDTITVEIMARGTPADGLILGDNVHGEPSAFADNWPNRARFWFPSNDHPSDRATVTFTVHAPEGRRVVANGVRTVGPRLADPTRTGGIEGLFTWRWESWVPIPPHLMVIGVSDFEVIDHGLGACGRSPASPRDDRCVAVSAWTFPQDAEHGKRTFAQSARMLDFYSGLFGPYPFEKLANVQAATRFGGMENASTIFYSQQAVAQGRDLEGTLAHEIVHQWFGNSVTPADWPHLWLSEGFASYFGPYFREATMDEAGFQSALAAARNRYFASEVTGRPIVDRAPANLLDLLNENSYEKGALVLHMLRWVMGDQAFFNGVNRYYQRHAGGTVETEDFQRAMEATWGDTLEWFFRQWVRSPGYPEYRTSWRWNASTRSAEVLVVQTQDGSWPTYRMPIELEFRLDGGVHRVMRWVDGREWVVSIPLPQQPTEMRFDPDGWMLMREIRVEGN